MAGSITTLGVGSGLQLQDILDQLREVDQEVITRKQSDIDTIDVQLEEFTTVKNQLLTLKSAALDLSLSGTFLGRTVETSDEKIIGATALDGATVKSTTIDVTKLAEQSSWLSGGFSSSAEDVVTNADSIFSYSVGDTLVNVDVSAGSGLESLAAMINDDDNNPGITASVVNTGEAGTPYKLLVQANETGDLNRIDILAVPDLMSMDRQQDIAETLNAKFDIDGISYQRSSNSFNDVIAGVTINLKDEGKATVTVQSNDQDLKDKITAFVEAYNEVYLEVKVQSSYDSETGAFGSLSSTTLRDLPYELQGLMSSFSKGDTSKGVQSLFDLGVEFGRDGTGTINQETLTSVISNSADKVKLFFLGDPDNEVEGFADKINSRLRTLTSTGGIVEAEKTAAQSRIDNLQQYIEDQTARLDKRYDQLTKQFVALDKFMNEMTSMSAFLSGQFDSLSNNWGTSNK